MFIFSAYLPVTLFPFALKACVQPYVQSREIKFNEWIEGGTKVIGIGFCCSVSS